MKRDEIVRLVYDYLHGYRAMLEDEFGSLEMEDFIEHAAYYLNWSELDREKIKPGPDQHRHPEGATMYRMWFLKSHPDIRVHIWHNDDMLVSVSIVRV